MRVFSFLRSGKGASPAPTTGADGILRTLVKKAESTNRRSYLAYLFASFRNTSPYALWQRARAAFAPAIFLSRVFRVLRWVFRILETSALLLFAAALLLLATPFLLAAVIFLAVTVVVSCRYADRRLSPFLTDKRVLVLFSSPESGGGALASLSSAYTVLLVIPRFAPPPAGTGRFPITAAARRREDGVILVRDDYYFHLLRTRLFRPAFCARIY